MSNISNLKGRPASETHECFPVKRASNTGRVTEVKWVPKSSSTQLTTTPKFKSWVSVYHVFMSIADSVLDLPEGIDHDIAHLIIANLIESLYAQHKGEPSWDIAYTKWSEPSYDNEEE